MIETKYTIRHKKKGTYPEFRIESNDGGDFCDSIRYIIELSYKTELNNETWMLDSIDAIVNAITLDTEWYNAGRLETPMIDFDYSEDAFEFVKITKTIELETVTYK